MEKKTIKITADSKMVEIPIKKPITREILEEYVKEKEKEFFKTIKHTFNEIAEEIDESILMPCFYTNVEIGDGLGGRPVVIMTIKMDTRLKKIMGVNVPVIDDDIMDEIQDLLEHRGFGKNVGYDRKKAEITVLPRMYDDYIMDSADYWFAVLEDYQREMGR